MSSKTPSQEKFLRISFSSHRSHSSLFTVSACFWKTEALEDATALGSRTGILHWHIRADPVGGSVP